MKNILIVCEKPHHRKVVESYLHKNPPGDYQLHFDTMAFVLGLNNPFIKPISKTEQGYEVGALGNSCHFEQFALSNTTFDTKGYIIETHRPKLNFTVEYDNILFVCGTRAEHMLSVYGYCERNGIENTRATLVPVLCMADDFVKNIFDTSRWYPLKKPPVKVLG